MEKFRKIESKENLAVTVGESSPISKLLQNYKGDPVDYFNTLSISSPDRDFGPPPAFTPAFGNMKPFNPYLN